MYGGSIYTIHCLHKEAFVSTEPWSPRVIERLTTNKLGKLVFLPTIEHSNGFDHLTFLMKGYSTFIIRWAELLKIGPNCLTIRRHRKKGPNYKKSGGRIDLSTFIIRWAELLKVGPNCFNNSAPPEKGAELQKSGGRIDFFLGAE